jgi:glycerol-3-phosphate cytidylyltransferase-like family protein
VAQFVYMTVMFWMQAKALGSKLIVGIPGKNVKDMVLNACASSSVDTVIAEAPAKADLMFLEKQGIDFIVTAAGQPKFVTDEVVNANRCLAIGEDGVARPLKEKAQHND